MESMEPEEISNSQFKPKMIRPCHQYSTALKFIPSLYQRGKLIRALAHRHVRTRWMRVDFG